MIRAAFHLPHHELHCFQGETQAANFGYGFYVHGFQSTALHTHHSVDQIKWEEIELPSCPITSTPHEVYLDYVSNAINLIEHTALRKVVLSRILVVDKPNGFSPDTFLKKLHDKHPDAFTYALHHPEVGCWMGASPEILYEQHDNSGRTMALAGTLPLDSGEWTMKEYTEQQAVTDNITQRLEELEVKYVLGETTDKPAGEMRHLCTEFMITPNRMPASQISEALHPTPAVCGTPTAIAKETIKKLEPHDRGLYTGYIGYIDENNHASYFVNLRCMQVFSDKLVLYLGGGITAQSDAEKEWQETELKARTMLDLVEKM